jgi:ABC-type cobalamin/Fe3+-siderophores transport system ATPase subunit
VKLIRLELERFTAFEEASFEFASGVNVLIGENGTGKSHLLKLIYCVSESVRRHTTGEGLDQSVHKPELADVLAEMLAAVFQPDELGRLVRRGIGRRKARIRGTWRNGTDESTLEIELSSLGRLSIPKLSLPELERSIFIPTREVLSIFPGFISSYLKRESAFDRTVYDLCLALDSKPLRGPRNDIRARLLQPLEDALGGSVVNEKGYFYLKLPDGNMEAPLVAEGIRKLGMLDYLIVNGSLTENGFLLWDEPEASLNPRLTRLTGHIAVELARSGVQTWIATHDYLLTSELALASERLIADDTSFFALAREPNVEGTFVERGSKLADLQHNSILKALADLHEREEAAFLGDPS